MGLVNLANGPKQPLVLPRTNYRNFSRGRDEVFDSRSILHPDLLVRLYRVEGEGRADSQCARDGAGDEGGGRFGEHVASGRVSAAAR